jgi:hypothetical protein
MIISASVFLAVRNSKQEKSSVFNKIFPKNKITVFLQHSHMLIDILSVFSMEHTAVKKQAKNWLKLIYFDSWIQQPFSQEK